MRSSLADLRSSVELALAKRVASPFGYRDRKLVETASSGIAEIDSLSGGFPRGGLTEICGPASSGRTTVLLSALAARTAQAEVCALIDARDSFDPHTAQAAGVELQQLLWVRCHSLDQSLQAADLLIQGGGFGFIALDLSDIPPEKVRHVPLNAWFRFRRAVEDTSTVLVVLEQESNAKTCASLVLQMKMQEVRWSAAAENSTPGISRYPHACLHAGLSLQAKLLHSRIQPRHFAPGRPAPICITGSTADRGGSGTDAHTRDFAARSAWSYLQGGLVEAKIQQP